MGLWLLLAWLVPIVVTGVPDVVGLAIGLFVLACGLGAFFFSLLGLHRQMVEVKENELTLARELYAEAYEPVREARTLEALERRHTPSEPPTPWKRGLVQSTIGRWRKGRGLGWSGL